MVSVNFSGRLEVEALLRSSVLFKFGESGDAAPFVGSPVFSAALRSLLESVIDSCARSGDDATCERWRKTYRLSGHPERWKFVAKYSARHPKWGLLSIADREEWVETVASPYWLSREEHAEMQSEIARIQE
ncbi:hypothetical protein GCM10010341_35130 [Streptomyces noursei]|nr:hypothetical protein GCM10010341_35130 [Streptomyces noursei]